MKKFFTISAALTVAFSTFAFEDVSVVWANIPGQFLVEGISDDGNYVCGNNTIWNLLTGETISTYDSEVALLSISNTGTAVGSATDYAVSVEINGDMRYIEGMDFANFSTARGISADGSIIVGARYDKNYRQEPCYWQNGKHHVLPLPEEFEDIPDDVEIHSIATRGVSADGSVIVGSLITGTGAEAVVMWTRNDKGEYLFHPLYVGFMEFGWELEKPYIYMEPQGVSANGKWISLLLQPNSFEDMTYYAGRYNIETGKVEQAGTLDDYVGDYYPTGITNDGMVVGFIEQQYMSLYGRQSYIWAPDSESPCLLSKSCDDNSMLAEMEKSVTLVYSSVSGDGKHIAGFSIKNEDSNVNSFVINLNGASTGINTSLTDSETEKAIYNLQGVRVSDVTQPGIYIVKENGRSSKMIMK